jgi:hypothetical protein
MDYFYPASNTKPRYMRDVTASAVDMDPKKNKQV